MNGAGASEEMAPVSFGHALGGDFRKVQGYTVSSGHGLAKTVCVGFLLRRPWSCV